MSPLILVFLSIFFLQASANYATEIEKRGACPMHYVTGPRGICFRFAEDYKTHVLAQKQCEHEGANLAITQSSDIYRFVQQNIEANSKRAKIVKGLFHHVNKVFTKWSYGWWIGAQKKNHGFRWQDGKPVFGHWMYGMPDNGRLFLIHWMAENCIQQLESKNGWNDCPCDKKLRYVCQKEIVDPCAKVNCGNGKCLANDDEAVCLCNSGWTGTRCNRPAVVDVCHPNPCLNGGRCFANSLGFHCGCLGNYAGKKCEKKCRFVVTSGGMPRKLDAMIMLDGSTSVREADFEKSLKFLVRFVDKLEIGAHDARVGLVQFSHRHEREFSMRDSVKLGKNGVKRKILLLEQMTGGTATGRALEYVETIFKEEARAYSLTTARYILIVTDGNSHQEAIIRRVVPQLLKMDVNILAVGVGDAVDAGELLLLTGGNAGHVFSVDSFDQLNNDFLLKIMERMCD